MRQLRVGVIGVGWQGGGHLQLLSGYPRSELVAVCDLNEELLAQRAEEYPGVRTFTDYEELLAWDGVDAVVIVIPDHLHRGPAEAACQAGKHVLLEKPMATTVEDAEAIAAAARAGTGKFMVNLSNRWMYPFAKGKELVDSGSVGQVRYVFARMANRIEVPTEKLPWLQHSHLAHWIGIHRLDIARWWIGEEAMRVRAVQRKGVLSDKGFDTADFFQATIEFHDGAVVNLEGNWILPPSYPTLVDSKFYALCEHGVIDVDRLRSELMVAAEGFELSTPTAGQQLDQPGGFTYAAERHFVDCCLDDQPPLVTAEDGLALCKILSAVVHSCEANGQVVDL